MLERDKFCGKHGRESWGARAGTIFQGRIGSLP